MVDKRTLSGKKFISWGMSGTKTRAKERANEIRRKNPNTQVRVVKVSDGYQIFVH